MPPLYRLPRQLRDKQSSFIDLCKSKESGSRRRNKKWHLPDFDAVVRAESLTLLGEAFTRDAATWKENEKRLQLERVGDYLELMTCLKQSSLYTQTHKNYLFSGILYEGYCPESKNRFINKCLPIEQYLQQFHWKRQRVLQTSLLPSQLCPQRHYGNKMLYI